MTTPASPGSGPLPAAEARRLGLRNFRAVFAGRLVSALSVWMALAVLAKLSDPATVGLYALAQALCIPIAETAKMSLRELRSSDTTQDFSFGDYLGLRLLAAAAALVLMLAAGLAQTGGGAVMLVILLYALARCAELVSDMVYGLFQAHERMEYIGRSLCFLGPLSLLMLAGGYWLTGSLLVAVAGQLAAHLAVLFCYDLPRGRQRARICGDDFRPRWRHPQLPRLARLALPLTFATLLIIIALYFPRLAVERMLGLTELGLFAAVLALAMAPDRLVNAMGVAASVRLARHFAAGRRAAFLRLLTTLTLGVTAGGLAGVLLCAFYGAQILRAVYTEAYAAQHVLLVWLMAAATLRGAANILRYGVVATRRFWWLSLQNGAAALVAVTSCLLLIPRYGLTGAGAAMALVFAVQLIIVLIALALALKPQATAAIQKPQAPSPASHRESQP